MLQLTNESPFAAHFSISPDTAGVDTLSFAVRATFVVEGGKLVLAERQEPVALMDEYRGDPSESSLLCAADLHLPKPATDVVLLGDAYAPGGSTMDQMDVSVAVGPVQKTVRVLGDRSWSSVLGRMTSPEPFARMPLVYERAFGGILKRDPVTEEPLVDRRNPVGKGSARALPNLEDPTCLIRHPSDTPAPVGFGPIAPFWEPRSSYAGTYDERWRKTRAPYWPLDFDPRFFQVAHPDLIAPGRLQGGEPVVVRGASPRGVFRCSLPRCEIGVEVKIARSVERPLPLLATVILEPGEGRLGLVWQGSVRCDKKRLAVERVTVTLQTMDLGARAA